MGAVHCGASVRELYGALVFHNTIFSHLHTPLVHSTNRASECCEKYFGSPAARAQCAAASARV